MSKTSDILPKLEQWAAIHDEWMRQYDALHLITECSPDSPLALSMGHMFDAYTVTLSLDIGDKSRWLSWYCLDNEMGRRGLEVTIHGGKTIKVKTLAQLARVICY